MAVHPLRVWSRIKEHPTSCCKGTEMVDHAAGQGWSSVLARLLYGEEGAVGVCV